MATSIFNDVIGPAMRGPSSSHCAAAMRIGRMARDLMDGLIQDVLIEFDPDGSLATTHESHGTDIGLFSGFLGWDAMDERLVDSARAIKEAQINVKIRIVPINADHTSTYKMTISNSREMHIMTAISTGGGMIEVVEIDGVDVLMKGDYYETLVFFKSDGDRLTAHLNEIIPADNIHLLCGEAFGVREDCQGIAPKGRIGEYVHLQKTILSHSIPPLLFEHSLAAWCSLCAGPRDA